MHHRSVLFLWTTLFPHGPNTASWRIATRFVSSGERVTFWNTSTNSDMSRHALIFGGSTVHGMSGLFHNVLAEGSEQRNDGLFGKTRTPATLS
jgi:hypothetical protein